MWPSVIFAWYKAFKKTSGTFAVIDNLIILPLPSTYISGWTWGQEEIKT